MDIKKNDKVIVIAGKDRGKQAKVLRVIASDDKILLEGINVQKVHRKPRKSGEKGQIIQVAAPIHISNVQLWCSSCGKGVRTGSKVVGGKKIRICVSCKKEI